MSSPRTLSQSAKEALLWSGGFVFLRDLAQFAAMLAMVRLLAPEDYGTAALAQSIIGLLTVVSFGTFVMHALQLRDPGAVDWQGHFTAAVVVNTAIFLLTLILAWGLSLTATYRNAALPLAGLATVFLVEVPGTLRHRMLETRHDWARFRLLLIIGTFLGLGVGLVVALLGGGVWALVVQGPLFGLPAAIDLFWHGQWRPDWTWSWASYRDTARFGVNRMGAAAVLRGRQTAEHAMLSGIYDFAALGVFTRTIGLATLFAGRIGSLTMQALYPVVTRAEERTERFQRISGLVLRGVCWTSIPAAVFLALSAQDAVDLLYGQQWPAVAPLLPLAVAGVALSGIAAALSSLLLANNEMKLCLMLDIASASIALGLALWLVPIGIEIYLAGLAAHGLVVLLLTLAALAATGGVARSAFPQAFFPALFAAAGAAVMVGTLGALDIASDILVVRFLTEMTIFGLVYVAVLRMVFPKIMGDLLDVAPGGLRIARALLLPRGS